MRYSWNMVIPNPLNVALIGHVGIRSRDLERIITLYQEVLGLKLERGPVVKPKGKTRITIYLDDDVIEAYRRMGDERGLGYQTLINAALRETISPNRRPVDARTLRRILREELKKTG